MALQIYQQQDFTGGLNFRADQFQLADNESPDMKNVEIDPRGGLFSRGGMERINTTAVSGTWSPKMLHSFYGATPRVMLGTGAKIYQSTGGNFTALAYSVGNDIAVSNTAGPSFANWGTKLYMATGINGASSYSWVTTDTYATAIPVLTNSTWNNNYNSPGSNRFPRANYLAVHNNKMFAAGIHLNGAEYPNRLYWSHEDEPTDWAADDYIEINAGGSAINALAVVQGTLVIFKTNAIFVLFGYDSDDFRLVEIANNLGASYHYSVAQTEDGVYFYSAPEGLFFYDGVSIQDKFSALRPAQDLGYINSQYPDKIFVSWVRRRVWMSAPYSKTTTVTNATVNFVYDPSIGSNGAFTKFDTADGYGLYRGCDFTDASNNNLHLMTHPIQARVLKVDLFANETDNITGSNVNFTSYYRTKWFDGGSYMQKKMFRRPDFVVKEPLVSQVISIRVYHDFKDGDGEEQKNFDLTLAPPPGGIIWGTDTWGDTWGSGVVSSDVVIGKNLGLARTVQMEFTGPEGKSWGINSIGYKFQPRRVKG
jgi:hypothetical protein